MFTSRRCTRSLALAGATVTAALAPAVAQARPAVDPPVVERNSPATAPVESRTIVREIQAGGDTTLALILSGSALLIAAGGAALSGHDHRRLGRVA